MILHPDIPSTSSYYNHAPIHVYDADQIRVYDSVHYGTSRQSDQ